MQTFSIRVQESNRLLSVVEGNFGKDHYVIASVLRNVAQLAVDEATAISFNKCSVEVIFGGRLIRDEMTGKPVSVKGGVLMCWWPMNGGRIHPRAEFSIQYMRVCSIPDCDTPVSELQGRCDRCQRAFSE